MILHVELQSLLIDTHFTVTTWLNTIIVCFKCIVHVVFIFESLPHNLKSTILNSVNACVQSDGGGDDKCDK